MVNKYFLATFFNRFNGDSCPICTERVCIEDLRKYRKRIFDFGCFMRYFMHLKFDFVVFTYLDDYRYARWFDYEEFSCNNKKKRVIPFGSPAFYDMCYINLQYLRSSACVDDVESINSQDISEDNLPF